MTFEEYKTELNARMAALGWHEKEDLTARLKSPAHDLMVQASRDENLPLDDFEKLSHIFYGW